VLLIVCAQRLALCTSAVMYMMSRDHLSMHIDASSLQLMLQLLSVDSSRQSTDDDDDDDDDDLCRTRRRLHDIVQQTGGHTAVTLDNMTVSRSDVVSFVMMLDILLSLSS